MKIYVINLIRSADRRESITAQLNKLGLAFELVEAIDGNALSHEALLSRVDRARYDSWPEMQRPGAMGCALSHREACQRLVDDGAPCALILEDDVEVSPNLPDLLEQLAAEVADGSLLLLHFHSNWPVGLSKSDVIPLPHGHFLHAINRYTYFGSAAGYLISKNTAAALIASQTPIFTLADAWVDFHRLGALNRFALVVPSLVTPKGFKSAIGYSETTSYRRRMLAAVESFPPLNAGLRLLRRIGENRRRRIEYVD